MSEKQGAFPYCCECQVCHGWVERVFKVVTAGHNRKIREYLCCKMCLSVVDEAYKFAGRQGRRQGRLHGISVDVDALFEKISLSTGH